MRSICQTFSREWTNPVLFLSLSHLTAQPAPGTW